MTYKQSKFLQEFISTGNGTEAAMQAYECKNRDSARSIASQNLAKLNIRQVFDELGLTDVRIAELIIQGIESQNLVIRYKYLELAIKLKGLFEINKKGKSDSVSSLNDLLSLLSLEGTTIT